MNESVVVSSSERAVAEESSRNGRARGEKAAGQRLDEHPPRRVGWLAPTLLLLGVIAAGAGLAWWKVTALKGAAAAASNQPEPVEAVILAVAKERQHRRTSTSIGTVMALRSITLRNEMAG